MTREQLELENRLLWKSLDDIQEQLSQIDWYDPEMDLLLEIAYLVLNKTKE